MADDTDLGPLATEQVLADVTRQVADSVAAGARLLCGGKRIGTRGNFYAPTALADLPTAAPAYREEVFGPVAGVFAVQDAGAAIALANASPFGLGASVWTTDEAEQRRFIDEFEVGMTFVNAMVASDPRLPFGGVKRSGHGRELSAVGGRHPRVRQPQDRLPRRRAVTARRRDQLMTAYLQSKHPAPPSHCSPNAASTMPSPQYGAIVQATVHLPGPYWSRPTFCAPLSHCSGPFFMASPQNAACLHSVVQVP
jgi:delta 1-pyrroline-5-carboxylate dehydrogenase